MSMEYREFMCIAQLKDKTEEINQNKSLFSKDFHRQTRGRIYNLDMTSTI